MSSGHLFCADRNGVKKLFVLAQDYPSAPANPSGCAKRDARGLRRLIPAEIKMTTSHKVVLIVLTNKKTYYIIKNILGAKEAFYAWCNVTIGCTCRYGRLLLY